MSTLSVKVVKDKLELRSQPVSSGSIVANLAVNTVLEVLGANSALKIGNVNEWLNVKAPSGKVGYIQSSGVTIITDSATSQTSNPYIDLGGQKMVAPPPLAGYPASIKTIDLGGNSKFDVEDAEEL